jgi:hypothetical protein
MVDDFITKKSPPPIDLGYGRFIEVSLKESPNGNEFIQVAKGEHWFDGEKPRKRYQKAITIPSNNGTVENVIKALKEISNPEIDKG